MCGWGEDGLGCVCICVYVCKCVCVCVCAFYKSHIHALSFHSLLTRQYLTTYTLSFSLSSLSFSSFPLSRIPSSSHHVSLPSPFPFHQSPFHLLPLIPSLFLIPSPFHPSLSHPSPSHPSPSHPKQVAWFHMDRKMLLTLDKMVVTRIPRFSVTQDDDHTWTLHIDAVTRDDRGQYMCQVNTEPMVTQVGYLDVVGECYGVWFGLEEEEGEEEEEEKEEEKRRRRRRGGGRGGEGTHIGTHRKNKQQQAYWPLRGCL